MTFNISPDIIENDDVKLDINSDGELEITNVSNGVSIVIDESITVSNINTSSNWE